MKLKVFDLGLVDFAQAWNFQKTTFEQTKNGLLDSSLIFCQHYPVITLGRGADSKNILIAEDKLASYGIKKYAIERGGDVTYHGPGQMTVYPIFNLNYFKKDIHWFLRRLEDTVMNCLWGLSVKSQRRPGLTGVWIDQQKIASIGIAIKNWITYHGLSINIKKGDLPNFSLIRPCGMDIKMTALENILPYPVDSRRIKEILLDKFKEEFYA